MSLEKKAKRRYIRIALNYIVLQTPNGKNAVWAMLKFSSIKLLTICGKLFIVPNKNTFISIFTNFSVVMRRDKILKICLNHALTTEIDYQPKDDKSWHFVAQDFSEGKVELLQFCLRFKNAEIATAFKSAVDAALSGSLTEAVVPEIITGASGDTAQTQISDEDKQLAESLKLPINFFAYKNTASSCTGCRGCQTPDFQFAEIKQINLDVEDENPLPLTHPASRSRRTTPQVSFVKVNDTNNQSSVFGGTSLSGGSVFGSTTTPFGASPSTANIFGKADKPSIFASAQKSIFGGTGNVAENGAKPLPSQSFSFGTPTTESPFKALADTTKIAGSESFSFKSTSLFGQAATLSANSAADQQPKSIFGGDNLFKAAGNNIELTFIFIFYVFEIILCSENNIGVSSTTPSTGAPKSIFGGASIFNVASKSGNICIFCINLLSCI